MFTDAVEEVKRQIVRRRIKQEWELNNKARRMNSSDRVDEEQEARFEETLVKLVGMAKGKVNYDEFTSVDKYNLVELFVTNETTLLHIYACLFQQQHQHN